MKNHSIQLRSMLDRVFAGVVLPVLTAVVLLPATALTVTAGRNPNPGIAVPGSMPHGQSYSQWSGAWWTWALSTPASVNPLTDPDGRFASVNQSGSVWFLAGNFGGTTIRTITVPKGKALFIPIVNYFAAFLPGEDVDVPAARAFIQEQIDTASNLACEIDGIPVKNLASYREQSEIFSFVIPEDNIFGEPSFGGLTAYPSVDDGIYLMLSPPKPGPHTIRIHACLNDCAFELDVTYHITVE